MKTALKIILLLPLIISIHISPAFSQDEADSQDSLIEPEAMTVLMSMAQNLSTLSKARVVIKNGYDAVQDNGQKIEFSSVREVKFKRPGLCRFDVTEFNGDTKGFIFDGNNITVIDDSEKVYASAPKPGTCDEAIEYTKEQLQVPLPMSQLFNSRLPQTLKEIITEITVVEKFESSKEPITHIAFRAEEADVQVWINTKTNLPKKVIISYKDAPEHPQFWAYFKEWDLSPRLKDSDFSFKPPEGYEKISFSPVKIMEIKEEMKDDKK